jgi:phosphoribosylformylglycinamidine synthase I
MKAAVVVFPGSNREHDVAKALERASGKAPKLIWHGEASLGDKYDLIVLPGGFSYGDYLRCGAMAAHSPITRDIIRQASNGTPVLGICNGFQILVETGLLPGALMRNASLKFASRYVTMRVEATNTMFTSRYKAGQELSVPVAHGDGNYFADDDTLSQLEDEGRVAFRYVTGHNPNGASHDIAGILNAKRNVLGLMPHPENATDPLLGSTDGKGLFDSLASAIS